MPLVGTTEMFKKAYQGHYAIGAFNVNNMEIIQGIMEAAKEEESPVILQASEGARNYAGQEYIVGLVKTALQDYPEIPTALHLDHGSSYEICKACIDGGFTSVMYDGSKHSFEENVKVTKQIVEYAHDKGVVVEAELGRLAGVEDLVSVDAKDAIFTDPEEAAEFVELTGCDSLAIAIGTSHGAYKFKGDPYLDYERLEKVVSSCRTTRSSSMALLPSFRNLWKSAMPMAAKSSARKESRKTCSARLPRWLSARSISTPISVWL